MSGFVLHVGLPKTGSTTIQRSLFKNHSQVFYMGKTVGNGVTKGCKDQGVYKFLKPLIWRPHKTYNLQQSRDFYNKNIVPNIQHNQIILGSWEAIGNGDTHRFVERIKRLSAVFGGCRILIILRNPLTLIPSLYLQNLRGNYIKRRRPEFAGKPYLTLEDWLLIKEKRAGGFNNWLNYISNIEHSVELLGEENVGVFLFEDLISNPKQYYNNIANFLGIDAKECRQLTEEKHFHPRLMQCDIDYIQSLNTLSFKRLNWIFSHRKFRRQRLEQNRLDSTSMHQKTPVKISLSEEWTQKVIQATSSGYQRLETNLQLELRKHNYPLSE